MNNKCEYCGKKINRDNLNKKCKICLIRAKIYSLGLRISEIERSINKIEKPKDLNSLNY